MENRILHISIINRDSLCPVKLRSLSKCSSLADGLIKYLNEEVIKMKVSLNQDVASTLYPLTYLSALTFTSSLRVTHSVDHVRK